jgi:hypothetical protein
MLILGFLPQHVWQVGGGVFAVYSVITGLILVMRTKARRYGAMTLLIGLAVGVAAATVDPEPACGSCGGDNHWGGTSGVVILGIWVVAMSGLAAFNIRRAWSGRR